MIPDAQMTEDLKVFFESIIKLIHLKTQKKESKETREDDEDTQDLDQINIADEDDLQERLDFCIPRCNYFISHDGACDIRLGNSVFLSLSADEISRINDTALKNYIS